jgi:hypothetical protein
MVERDSRWNPPPSELSPFPYQDPDSDIAKQVVDRFYDETRAAVAAATGADRVIVFDHTVRKAWGGADASLNSDGNSAAGSVARVHCDYTADSGVARLGLLMDKGVVPRSTNGRQPRR